MPENRRIRQAIVIERAGDPYSATVPDLPGGFDMASTDADAKYAIVDALGVRIDGEPVPEPASPVGPQQAERGGDSFATLGMGRRGGLRRPLTARANPQSN